MLFIVTFAFLIALSWGFPKDIVVQFERRVLVNGTVVEKILVSHPNLKGQSDTQPVVRPIRDEVLRMMVENDQATANTYIRLRDCKMRGYQVLQLSDRFQLNGSDCLSLDPESDLWTVLMPEAQNLKQSWTLEAEHTSLEKVHLKEECEEFVKHMNESQNQEEMSVLRVMAPVLATFIFIGLLFIMHLIYKRYGQQPGGVLGSIIHYTARQFELPFDEQRQVPVSKSHY